MYVRCSALSPKLILKLLLFFYRFPLNARSLFIVRANVSNLSQIDVRFVMDFFDICHKQMLIHVFDYITFVQLSVNECMNYKQCLNSLRTALA